MALYYELPIYKDTYQLVMQVFRLTRNFSREYKYTIGQDIKKDSMEMVRHIFKANSTNDKGPHLQNMYDTLEVVKLQLRICVDMRLISPKQQSDIWLLVDSIGRQLMGWKNKMK
ncbi:hypothetical protein FACS189421_11860 [Bacteroidia bacterium]|nr:hypothetical protein FACS189421_11860 [Bacteroidia bacterium]GHT05806.1 hypothetical protein FACS189423_10370 [Bacteroidia bacterium]GHT49988.1 hypothetical protein FACS189440_16630 [Bacteroidia bacterium]